MPEAARRTPSLAAGKLAVLGGGDGALINTARSTRSEAAKPSRPSSASMADNSPNSPTSPHSPNSPKASRRIGEAPLLRRSKTVGALGGGNGSLAKSGREMVASKPSGRLFSKSAARPSSAKAVLEVTARDEDSFRVDKKKISKMDQLVQEATKYASKYRLDVAEVRLILEELDRVEKTPEKSLTMEVMGVFLCRIFGAPSIPNSILSKVHELVNLDMQGNPKPFEISTFLDWYLSNIITTVTYLKADPKAVAARSMLSMLCKKYELLPTDLDTIKMTFDKYDIDGSGFIDKDEFEKMLASLLNAKKADMSAERLKSFWVEIDTDGNGEVDFEEFVQWYLKYFGATTDAADAFYASFNPRNARAELLRKMQADVMF